MSTLLPSSGSAAGSADEGIRLQKVLAAAGVGSRRACEELIRDGRVEVDGEIVTTLGTRVDPRRAVIRVDGKRIAPPAPHRYLVVNKPRGVLTAMTDRRGRPCLGDLLPPELGRLFHVGRLDADSEGLLLVTNDGELAHRLMHPSHEVPKKYVVWVRGAVGRPALRRLREGVALDDGPAAADAVRVLEKLPDRSIVEIVVHEGRTHLVRRLMAAVGHPVERLVRTAIGPIELGTLRPGRWREVTNRERGELLDLVESSIEPRRSGSDSRSMPRSRTSGRGSARSSARMKRQNSDDLAQDE
ncbi:MAG: rRNA pseudouridine synthase [Acidothermus sp.]|nr:rRNA pseudouridine synthase [Acidothermus sp.]